ncbi:unnamed protein product [Paramecium octaurelia]|uniref:Uncharacterized protein n=1 Tax=Paramecium octaurelia TaxID=43137 RepID=A0A8S1Y6N9_PAROT|nr:unnamed protein product [Paramecium octaurelia]
MKIHQEKLSNGLWQIIKKISEKLVYLVQEFINSDRVYVYYLLESARCNTKRINKLIDFIKLEDTINKSKVNKMISVRQYTSVPENVQYKQKSLNLIQQLNKIMNYH